MAALTAYDVNLRSNGQGKLQQVLGTTETSPAKIVLHANINKWSKVKPIRYPKYEKLLASEFSGSTSDHMQGYWYGVLCATEGTKWSNLHNIDFTYLRPTGGDNSPGRLSDFIGYDHAAVATMRASVLSTGYRDLVNNYRVNIAIDTTGTNTTGIDIANIVQEASGLQLSTCFPFILVGSYVSALKNASHGDGQGNYPVTKIFYENAWQRNFLADLSTCPGLGIGTIKVTVFLVPSTSGSILPPLDGSWTDLSDSTPQLFSARAFPMPDGTGMDVYISDYYEAAMPAKVGVSANSTGIHTLISWPSGEPTSTTTVRVTLRLGTSSVMQYAKEGTYTPGGFMQFIYWTWSELGMLYYEGMQITLSVSVQTAIQGSSKWTQGEGFSGTITAQ